jgi:hypothetical protein
MSIKIQCQRKPLSIGSTFLQPKQAFIPKYGDRGARNLGLHPPLPVDNLRKPVDSIRPLNGYKRLKSAYKLTKGVGYNQPAMLRRH